MNLRPYQQDMLARTRAAMRQGCRRLVLQAPTGSGKTVICAHMVGEAARRGRRAWFTMHRRELLEQTRRAFDLAGIRYGVVAAGETPDYGQAVQIASIQTLVRRLDRLQPPDMLIVDECHHQAAGQWSKVHRHVGDCWKIGLTATPARLDGKGLHPWYDQIVEGPRVRTLIDQGFLADYDLFAPSQPSLAGVRRIAGDYDRSALALAMDRPSITGCAVAEYQRRAPGAHGAIAFCVSIAHSQHTAGMFRAAGVRAEHLDGTMGARQRDAIMGRFRRGELQVVCNCDLFGEGLDVPGIEAAILLRPTQSLTLYLQQVGRSLRPSAGRAVILDHAGNCYRHGLPCDERQWTLADRERPAKGAKQEVHVRVCPVCFYAQAPTQPVCAGCGHGYQVQEREIEQVAGELAKVTSIKRKQEQGMADSMADLIDLGRRRGYKNPRGWAWYVSKARQNKRNVRI